MKKYFLIIMILLYVVMFSGCDLSTQKTQLKLKVPGTNANKMSFVGVGDNLFYNSMYYQADSNA